MGSFFISYTKPDEDWARWVDRVLRANGHDTFAMFADIPPGTNFIFEMHRALQSGARILPLLSHAALGSNGMLQEWGNALAGDLGLMTRPVIPVRIADCKPDGLLQALVYVDLVGMKDEEAAIESLSRGVDPDRDPRAEPAPFPGGRGGVVRPDVPFPAADKGNADWPEYVNSDVIAHREIVGRNDDVAELRRKLTDNDAAAIVPGAVVRGQGGVGKSTLARFFYETCRDRYEGVWWLKAETEQGIVQGLAELAQTLEIGKPGTPQEALARAALTEVQRRKKPWLLVYDDAPAAKEIARWQPATGKVHVLVTSREGHWPKQFAVQRAERLPLPDAVRLLMQEAGRHGDVEGAERLATTLDRLPLALVCAGAWLRDVASESFDDYRAKWEERLAHKPETVEDYPDSVYGAVKLSLDRLGLDAALLMKVMSYLAPDDLWAGLVTALALLSHHEEAVKRVPEELWNLARDTATVEHAFAELERRSFAERGDDRDGQPSWRVHRLTQAVQRAVLEGQEKARPTQSRRRPKEIYWHTVAAEMVSAAYPGGANSPAYRENWPICARLAPHVAALSANPPAVAAMDFLLHQASGYLGEQRRDEQALVYAMEALRLKEARLGPTHEGVGTGCNNLALRLSRMGKIVEAEAVAARAVAIGNIAKVPEEKQAVWLSTHGLTAGLLARGLVGTARAEKFAWAVRRYREALAIRLRLHGRASQEIEKISNNLGGLRAFQGRWSAALRLHGRALAVLRMAPPSGDLDLATSMHNLGSVLLQSGRAREGYRGMGTLELLEGALAFREKAFDRRDHHDRVSSAKWLAGAHWAVLEIGPPATGCVRASPARAQELCNAYEIDAREIMQGAFSFASRARLYERGQAVPPMPGEGE